MGLSFFGKPSYIGNRHPQHFADPWRILLSSEIRGNQIAQYLGASYNPTERPKGDIGIWLKPSSLKYVPDGDWVDILDGPWLVECLKSRPKVNAIAVTQHMFDTLVQELSNRLVFIPHHHVNWEREQRPERPIRVAGYTGNPSPKALKIYSRVEEAVRAVGLEFITCFNYQTREDAVKFYQSIDVLVIGPWSKEDLGKAPTKLINAGSFGIPTIAYPLKGYKEFESNYIHAYDYRQITHELRKLQFLSRYAFWSNRAKIASEPYHISRIAELYKVLT